uniref:Uncharacterized protein n=1 Tax=Oncorhynchus tshawytscha TaxID=74940 RepID=A0A8C8GPN5_ONCTS
SHVLFVIFVQNSAKSRKQLFKFRFVWRCSSTLTAYPDDECMFFVPTILRLEELNASSFVYLKVGNYYNQCVQLPGSCAVLGIPASRVIMHDYLPDDPNVEWRISMASSLILKYPPLSPLGSHCYYLFALTTTNISRNWCLYVLLYIFFSSK